MAIDVKKILADTLITISSKKPLAKITIKDLVESSGVGRQTFYNHFSDKLDLINWTYSNTINIHFKWILMGCPISPEDKARYTIACIPDVLKKYLPINE